MATQQSFICRESPTGELNGINKEFIVSNIPNPNSEQVFLNGVLQNEGASNDYTLSGQTITFSIPPNSDDVVLVNYIIDVVENIAEDSSTTTNFGRMDLIRWCLRKLGAPVIEINVDEDQIEDRVDEALIYFRDYHFDGVERCYLTHQITASTLTLEHDFNSDIMKGVVLTGDSSGAKAVAFDKSVNKRIIRFQTTNGTFQEGEFVSISGLTEKAKVLSVTLGDVDRKYVPVAPGVISITNVLPQQKATIGGNFGGMFDFQYQFALHNMFNLASTDLVTYDIYQRYMSTWEFMFRGTKGIRFNRKTDRVYLDLQSWAVDQWIVLEAWVALNPTTYTEIYMDEFVREYACALIKQQWGTNLKKFSGIQLPGTATLNGQTIYDEAKSELDTLRERVKKEFQLPPDFLVG